LRLARERALAAARAGGCAGDSKDFGVVIHRHALVNTKSRNKGFNVKKMKGEAEALAPCQPHFVNLHDKARFEALGCPVDTARIEALVQAKGAHLN
jgi:hypothetical protein